MSNSRRVRPHKPEEPPERGHHVLDIHDGQLGMTVELRTNDEEEEEASDGEMGR